MPTTKNTQKTAESRCESYTREQLKLLEWNLNKPENGGDTAEKQELRNNPKLKNFSDIPEFVLSVDKSPEVVIECKNTSDKIDLASSEAKDYADSLGLKIAIGVAGNMEDGVLVQNWFKIKDEFKLVTFHKIALTQILSKRYVRRLLVLNSNEIDQISLPDEKRFYNEAEQIHKWLYESSVSSKDMAVVLATIIIAFHSDHNTLMQPNFNNIDLINSISKNKLQEYGKLDLIDLFQISISKTTSTDKLKWHIPLIINSLYRLDVLPLLESGADILGKFFELFLRYSNDQRELGIVFTPRHIVELMCDLADIQYTDTVLDPCCGTGGFLVGAFSKMRNQLQNTPLEPQIYEQEMEKLKSQRLFGIEEDTSKRIYGLACLNMIFRGDGHNNIRHDDCFKVEEFEFEIKENNKRQIQTIAQFDKVLINPPYAQIVNETKFLDYCLKHLKPNGLLCAIIPYSVLCERNTDKWRNGIMMKHRILASITVPVELFYPISAPAVIILIEAHSPQANRPIFFGRIENDGFFIDRKKRSQRFTLDEKDKEIWDYGQAIEIKKEFIKWNALQKANIQQPTKITSIVQSVEKLNHKQELVAEAYIDSQITDSQIISNSVFEVIQSQFLFQMKFCKKLKEIRYKENLESNFRVFTEKLILQKVGNSNLKNILDFFEPQEIDKQFVPCIYGDQELEKKSILEKGDTIVISSGSGDNGLHDFYNFPILWQDLPILTLPRTGSIGFAFVQELPCSVASDTLIFIPKKDLDKELLYYIAGILRLESWRFSYGRTMSPYRVSQIKIDLSFYDKEAIKKYRDNLPFLAIKPMIKPML